MLSPTMAANGKLDELKRIPLFAGLQKRELEELGTLADEIEVADGRALTKEGESGHEFFVVVQGHVSVEIGGARVAELGPGDFLGEIALIDGKPRSATTRAVGDTRLIVIGHREFHQLMADFPTVQTAVLQALADRVRRNEQIS
jgi:CRP/FNR family cyclic AMP-dependent transcriptional regulator